MLWVLRRDVTVQLYLFPGVTATKDCVLKFPLFLLKLR